MRGEVKRRRIRRCPARWFAKFFVPDWCWRQKVDPCGVCAMIPDAFGPFWGSDRLSKYSMWS